ncbi:DUF7681 family protein [Providencia rettgeri]
MNHKKFQTYGERAVGMSFNPSNDSVVDQIKRHFADIIDKLNIERSNTVNEEAKRMLTIAIENAQQSQMWAVKAVTWSK